MRTVKKRVFSLLWLLFLISFSGCWLFRKKNKCATCPKWDKAQISAPLPSFYC